MHPHGLVSLNAGVNTNLVTLASKAALTIDQTLAGLVGAFLIKRVRYFLQLEALAAGEGPLIIGVANGDMNDAEIAAGMIASNTVGPEDVTQVLTQDTAWKILRETLEQVESRNQSSTKLSTNGLWHTMPKRGIPMPRDGGMRTFVFNADTAALTTGAVAKGHVEYQGVWLRD